MKQAKTSDLSQEWIIEPTLDGNSLERYPELDDELRVPNFIIFILEKPPAYGQGRP